MKGPRQNGPHEKQHAKFGPQRKRKRLLLRADFPWYSRFCAGCGGGFVRVNIPQMQSPQNSENCTFFAGCGAVHRSAAFCRPKDRNGISRQRQRRGETARRPKRPEAAGRMCRRRDTPRKRSGRPFRKAGGRTASCRGGYLYLPVGSSSPTSCRGVHLHRPIGGSSPGLLLELHLYLPTGGSSPACRRRPRRTALAQRRKEEKETILEREAAPYRRFGSVKCKEKVTPRAPAHRIEPDKGVHLVSMMDVYFFRGDRYVFHCRRD